ncbi:metallophosphoesterase family protein [uncultured Tateyamaria sp.]|uniref:metallophosphoesterase family protein n=1 Tax=uncultured Tateyamaria sp. TaxID=455651 RepID=UPI00260F4FD3|nr:metallophosphoesterase family protein [uncultured Tateyamaria sp.]
MRHADLGVLDGPVLIFGGPYSNLQATQAVLAEVRARRATPICTGDVAAYCARPVETIAAIRASGCAVVSGNCEVQLASDAPDCGCGFEAGTTCDMLSVGWYGFARAQVSKSDRDWMAHLPDVVTFHHQSARYGVIHGGVRDVARFLWSSSPASNLEDEWDALEAQIGPVDHILAGHSGIAFDRPLRRGRWINAGVIGMPPHNGCAATQFAVLDQGRATFHVLPYDVAGAAADMRSAGLTQGYHTTLETGYWPSEDVLPPDLRVPLAKG